MRTTELDFSRRAITLTFTFDHLVLILMCPTYSLAFIMHIPDTIDQTCVFKLSTDLTSQYMHDFTFILLAGKRKVS